MTEKKIVQPCESCVDVMTDKLSRWITLLGISGRNTKKLVRDEMKDFLKRQIREGGETR
jgi:cytidine deaminase